MPFFLSEENLVSGKPARLNGAEARHASGSRRLRVGDEILVQGPDGKRFLADITAVTRDEMRLLPSGQVTVPPEPLVPITLFQAYIAEQALDLVLQKSAELGAAEVAVFNSELGAKQLSLETFAKKQQRWERIFWEAAKQSERSVVPRLAFLADIPSLLHRLQTFDAVLLLDRNGQRLPDLKAVGNLAIVVGPEGGLSEAEAGQLASQKTLRAVSLGPTVLRAETASIAALAVCRNLLA